MSRSEFTDVIHAKIVGSGIKNPRQDDRQEKGYIHSVEQFFDFFNVKRIFLFHISPLPFVYFNLWIVLVVLGAKRNDTSQILEIEKT